MPFPFPMRYLDRSGRSLAWVMINEGTDWHTKQSAYDSAGCHIIICPREHTGQPQDITSRPCHSEGSSFFRLKDEIHEWLEEVDTYYQLEFRYLDMKLGWCVGFADKKHAVHFKLRWSNL